MGGGGLGGGARKEDDDWEEKHAGEEYRLRRASDAPRQRAIRGQTLNYNDDGDDDATPSP